MAKQALIIGGGHNGLVCACYLAAAGVDVTVLERRKLVGGAAVTEEFHPGFRNSVASYTVSLLNQKVIDELHLYRHGLNIIERPVNNFLPLPDGRSLTSFVEAERFHQQVAQFSTRDADHLQEFDGLLKGAVELIREQLLLTPPRLHESGIADIWKAFQLSRQFTKLSAANKQTLLKLFSISAGELLDDEFDSDPIKALIGFDSIVGNYASPYQAGSAYVLLHHVIGEVNGKQGRWGHAIGGMGAITQAMAREAESLGVKIETGCEVREVIVSGARAIGVSLASGETLTADHVVANVNPKLLFLRMIDACHLASDTVKHFQRYRCQSGTWRMNVALSELPEFTAETPENALTGGIIMAPDLAYMDNAYQDARRHGFAKQPIVEMLIPSTIDDSLAPVGKHVASLFCQQFDPGLGETWNHRRSEAEAAILDTVESYAPGFRDNILGMQSFSPWDLEQTFGLVGGDIFHGRLSLDQLFSARPMLGMGQYATEVDGLWMCGSGTHPGGGVSGLPGHNAAREILRRI